MDIPSLDITIAIYSKERFNFLRYTIKYFIKRHTNFNQLLIIYGDKGKSKTNNELLDLFLKEFDNIPYIIFKENNGTGLSSARNTAIQNSSAEYLAFLDDDAIPAKSYLNNLISRIKQKPDMIAGKVIPFSNKEIILPEYHFWILGSTYPPVYQNSRSHMVRNPIGANMIIRLDLIKKIGGFDSKTGRKGKLLLSGEERLIMTKLSDMGVKTFYDHRIKVYHNVPPERNRLQYFIKRSKFEGISKSMMKTNLENNQDTSEFLDLENLYLKYVLINSFSKNNSSKNINYVNELLLNFVIISSVLFGYILGIIKGKD